MFIPKSQLDYLVVLSNPKSPTRMEECVGKKESSERAPPLQFGEIYEWSKPKSLRVCTEAEFVGGEIYDPLFGS